MFMIWKNKNFTQRVYSYVYALYSYKISHMHFSASAVVNIKHKAKYRLHIAFSLLFYIIQRSPLRKSDYYRNNKCHFLLVWKLENLLKVENCTSSSALHILALRLKQGVEVPVNMSFEKNLWIHSLQHKTPGDSWKGCYFNIIQDMKLKTS
jgi:hypothetical protein